MAWKKIMFAEDGGIGFKSFEEFNQALLAKKLWRLNQHMNALVFRILKEDIFEIHIILRQINLIDPHMAGKYMDV